MLIGVGQTLNMIGFRKALKKFEKIAKVRIVVIGVNGLLNNFNFLSRYPLSKLIRSRRLNLTHSRRLQQFKVC